MAGQDGGQADETDPTLPKLRRTSAALALRGKHKIYHAVGVMAAYKS